MKVLLYYFTGTYNTLFIATLFKNILQLNKIDAEVRLIEGKDKNVKIDADIIGIAYPIYHHLSPKIIEKNLLKLNIENKKYFIFHTGKSDSSLNYASSYKINKILLKRNNMFCGEYHFLMPSNYEKKTNIELINCEINYAIRYVKYIVRHLLDEKKYHITIKNKMAYYLYGVSLFMYHINSFFIKVDKKKCNRCRKCLNQCVNGSIIYNKVKKRIQFKKSCIGCFRCLYLCQCDAINFALFNSKKVLKYYNFNELLDNYLKSEKIDLAKLTLSIKEKEYFKKLDDIIHL